MLSIRHRIGAIIAPLYANLTYERHCNVRIT